GTGFDASRLADIKAKLDKVQSDECPFAKRPAGVKAQWVEPALVCEVSFGEWTDDDRIRHSVFQGLRTDKPPRQIHRETASVPEPERARPARQDRPAMLKLRVTHADRVIDKESGITKGELVAYYEQVAGVMLPHLKGRPVALVRAPEGVGGELFFQKHRGAIPGLTELDPAFMPNHPPLVAVDSLKTLISCVQMNVVEFHTWNARTQSIEQPDRIVFDLDPGEHIVWPQIIEAAQLMKTMLDELRLKSFLKTSGGKGLHVVVPLLPHDDWQTVRDFSERIVRYMARTIPQ